MGKLKELAKLRLADKLKLAAKTPGIPDSAFTWNPIEWYKTHQIMKRAREAGINVLRSPEGFNAGLINGQPSINVSRVAKSTVAMEEYLHARYLQMVGPQKAAALLASNVKILKHETRLKNIMIRAGKRGTLGSKPLPVDVDFLIDTRIGYSARLSADLARIPK